MQHECANYATASCQSVSYTSMRTVQYNSITCSVHYQCFVQEYTDMWQKTISFLKYFLYCWQLFTTEVLFKPGAWEG